MAKILKFPKPPKKVPIDWEAMFNRSQWIMIPTPRRLSRTDRKIFELLCEVHNVCGSILHPNWLGGWDKPDIKMGERTPTSTARRKKRAQKLLSHKVYEGYGGQSGLNRRNNWRDKDWPSLSFYQLGNEHGLLPKKTIIVDGPSLVSSYGVKFPSDKPKPDLSLILKEPPQVGRGMVHPVITYDFATPASFSFSVNESWSVRQTFMKWMDFINDPKPSLKLVKNEPPKE